MLWGLVAGGFAVAGLVSLAQGRGVLLVGGFPSYGPGNFVGVSTSTLMVLIGCFLVVCLTLLVAGVLVLRLSATGIVASGVALLLAVPFWWGFVLPLAWPAGIVQAALLALGWPARVHSPRPGEG